MSKLSPEQYWEWRCTVEEVKSARLNEKRVHLERELKNKEIEINRLKLALFRETVKASRASAEAAQKELEDFTKSLEEELGVSFKDSYIDELTYELKPINNG